jgi:hypothetical protein
MDLKNPDFSQRPCQLTSYIWNFAESGFQEHVCVNCKVTAVWSSQCILFWEPYVAGNTIQALDAYNDGANYPYFSGYDEGLGTLHYKTGGYTPRLDGSVGFMKLADYNADAQSPAGQGPGPGGKTYTWWSTFSSNGH